MRVLHLPGKAVWSYSEEDIEDIIEYFNPDITVTTQMKYSLRKKVESRSFYETIHLESINGFKKRELNDEILVFLTDKQELKNIDFSDSGKKLKFIVTNLIKTEMKPMDFDFSLVNTSLVDELNKITDNFHVLSTEIEAGKKPDYKGNRIYGFGLSSGMSGDKIPNVITGKRPHIEYLDSKKVGLTAIPGLGSSFSTFLENEGISKRAELCNCDPEEMIKHDGIGPYRSTKWVCSARAIEENEVFKIKRNDLENQYRIFLDIETDSLQPEIIWHIGLFDDHQGKYKMLLEKDPNKKGRIIKRLMDYLEERKDNNICLLAWYGSEFDFVHLGNFVEKYDPERLDMWNSLEKIDFMYWTDNHAALPCRSQKLYDVSSRLGYDSDLLGLDGEDVARIYTRHMNDPNFEPDWEELKRYAKDDVISMKYVYDKIKEAPLLHDLDEIEKIYRRRT
ncbi:MAG: ribonuclease H-like domain-containing protein [Thermoplasmatota archaeon]